MKLILRDKRFRWFTALALVLAVAVVAISCSLVPSGALDRKGRTHCWAVDNEGEDIELTGTWRVRSTTHANSQYAVGDELVFPEDSLPDGVDDFEQQGIYLDRTGALWADCFRRLPSDGIWHLARVDTVVVPNEYHFVIRYDGFESPLHPYQDEDAEDYIIATRAP